MKQEVETASYRKGEVRADKDPSYRGGKKKNKQQQQTSSMKPSMTAGGK